MGIRNLFDFHNFYFTKHHQILHIQALLKRFVFKRYRFFYARPGCFDRLEPVDGNTKLSFMEIKKSTSEETGQRKDLRALGYRMQVARVP